MRIVFYLANFFLATLLTAQVARNHDVPLRNWQAPRYWQPSQAELGSHAVAGGGPLTGPLVFVAVTPCRIVDTRTSQGFPSPFGPPSLMAGATRSFPLQSSGFCGIPTTAQAYSFNVTVIPPGTLGFLTLWPEGQPQPTVVTLDDITGDIRNNAAVVAAGAPNGGISVTTNNTTDLVLDINGYYVSESDSSANTAFGQFTLAAGAGFDNSAFGNGALFSNSTGASNTAVGERALESNSTGSNNTALGFNAGDTITTGSNNTALGWEAGFNLTSGSNNIAIGSNAGSQITTQSNNIMIGTSGGSTDSGVIRIGSRNQTSFFVNAIAGVQVSSQAQVLIDTQTGQLGTIASSRRYKQDIQDMSEASSDLLRLRPVTFRYKQPYSDGSQPLDYGLIAEEVAEVYPDLVAKNADGQIETIQYHKLTPMLLNELQKEHETVQRQASALQKQAELLYSLQAQVSALQKALGALAGK